MVNFIVLFSYGEKIGHNDLIYLLKSKSTFSDTNG